ncbi:MAG: HDOD domain-containing protein [Burkholderiaceae bacterium]|nr:HDOD domain-containing protein [Burkholderiaceae bacterium]
MSGPSSFSPAVVAFVAEVGKLPLMPGLALVLVRSVQDERVGAAELGARIADDAGLAAQLLRLVNSPFYGFSRRIGTVSDAIAVLGFNLVRRIVTAAVLQRPQSSVLPDGPATRAFWRHQLLAAVLARFAQAQRGEEGEEQAYMAGLLHDIGCLAMHAYRPPESGLLVPSHTEGEEALVLEERARLGFDHAEAGAALLQAWQLPDILVQAVWQHASPTAPAEPTAASVWQANRLAYLIEQDPAPLQEQPWMRECGLGLADCQRLLAEVDAIAGPAR